jgi:hypothetical protein
MTKNSDDDANDASKPKKPAPAEQPFRQRLKTMKMILQPLPEDENPPEFDEPEEGNGSDAAGSGERLGQTEDHGPLDDFHYGPDEDAIQKRAIALLDMDRRDRALEQVRLGKPRIVNLSTGLFAVARLAEDTTKTLTTKRGDRDRADSDKVAHELALSLSEPMPLVGPSTEDAVDEMIAGLYAEFPSFVQALEAIRQSALLGISRGAAWFQFRPLIIVSEPGAGKSTLVRRLATAAAIPALHLDGTTISTATPFVGGDAIFRSSRASDLVQHVCQHKIANRSLLSMKPTR